MIPYPVLRDHSTPICHVCIITKGQDSRIWNLGRKQEARPWLLSTGGCPGPLSVARQPVYENDAASSYVSNVSAALLYLQRFEKIVLTVRTRHNLVLVHEML